MKFATQIRHQLTFLAGLGGLLLGWNLIAPEAVAEVNEAGAKLIEPLAVILGAVAVFLGRLALEWLSGIFRRRDKENKGGLSGMNLMMIVSVLASTGEALAGLPSCSSLNLSEYPIKGCVITDEGTVCYSSKGGLSYAVDARSGK